MRENSNLINTSVVIGAAHAAPRLKTRNVLSGFIRSSVLFGALMAILGLTTAPAFSQPSGCTLNTVNGSYGVQATGTLLGVGPVVAGGIFTTNGPGRFTYTFVQNVAGTVSSGTVRGTYTLSADCIGSAVFEDGQVYVAVVVNGGNEIDLISTVPTVLVETAVAKRIF